MDDWNEDEHNDLGDLGHASFTVMPSGLRTGSYRAAKVGVTDGDPALRFSADMPTWVNKAYLLDRRTGWTRTAIQKFLGEPEQQVRVYTGSMKHFINCLYSGERVRAIEESDEFRQWVARRNTKHTRPRRRKEGVACFGFWDGIPDAAKPAYKALCKRDREIIRLLFVRGLRQRTVALRLKISQQTVSRVRLLFVKQLESGGTGPAQNQQKMFSLNGHADTV